jgi:hypothetical protein
MKFINGYNILVSVDRMTPQIYFVSNDVPALSQIQEVWELQALHEESKDQPLTARYVRLASTIFSSCWPLEFPKNRACYLLPYAYQNRTGWISIVNFQAPDFRRSKKLEEVVVTSKKGDVFIRSNPKKQTVRSQ